MRRLGVLVLLGCSPSVDDLVLPLGRAGTVLVVSQAEGQAPEILVDAVPDPPPPYLALSVPDVPTQLWAIFSECDVTSLGLTAGTLAPSADDRGQPLPIPSLLLERSYAEEDPGTWSEAAAVPPQLVDLELAHSGDRCIDFSTTAQHFADGESTLFVMEPLLDGDGVFAVSHLGDFSLVYRDHIQPVATSTTLPHSGGYRDSMGRVWLIGADGAVSMWTEDSEPTEVRTSNRALGLFANQTWVDGSPDGSEIFAMDRRGGMARFDGEGGEWTVLDGGCRRGPPDCKPVLHGQVEWIQAGEALFVGDSPGIARRYRDGVRVDEPFGVRLDSLVQVLLADPDYGLVAGTKRGEILSLTAGVWTPRIMFSDMTRIDVLARNQRALLFGGDRGLLGQHHPGFGTCEFDLVTSGDIRMVRAMGTGLVVAVQVGGSSMTPNDDESYVAFLEPIGAVPECARRAHEVPGW